MKACPYCGQAVKVSSYRCPHCDRSLAEADQHEWERLERPVERSTSLHDAGDSRFSIRIPPAVITACLILVFSAIVIASLYGFFPGGSGKSKTDELPAIFSKPVRKPAGAAARKPKSGETSFIRIRDDSAPSVAGDAAEESAKPKGAVLEKRERREKIQRISAQILEGLREEEANKAYTIRLKSGKEFECDVVGESESQITIRLGGLTATLGRDTVESIERRSPETAKKELERHALARATEIVDQGLVRHGGGWITPQEKARRAQSIRRRDKTEQADMQTTKTQEGSKRRQDRDSFNAKTDREKLESLLSLVREKKIVDADFFGGTLHIEDRSDRWPGGNTGKASFAAFEASAERVDLSQLCDFLQLSVAASGLCNADIEAAFDERDPTTLSGDAQVACEQMTIPPFAISMLLSPLNKDAALSAALSAEDGAVAVKNFRLDGAAYSVTGGGTVRLADKPEQSRIDGLFSIILNEPPTVTGTKLAGKGAQFLLDALVGSGKEVSVTLSGPLSAPEARLASDSAAGSLVLKLDQ